jgi:hypothetical protein
MQSIKEISNKIKTIIDTPLKNNALFTILTILIVSICSFGLGRLSKDNQENSSISIQNNSLATISKYQEVQPPEVLSIGGKYVASKNSNKYHAPWCSGAQRIKEENKIWFNNKEEAEASGYTPASNCKGI